MDQRGMAASFRRVRQVRADAPTYRSPLVRRRGLDAPTRIDGVVYRSDETDVNILLSSIRPGFASFQQDQDIDAQLQCDDGGKRSSADARLGGSTVRRARRQLRRAHLQGPG